MSEHREPSSNADEGNAGVAATQSFYTRWAALYDAVATHTPGVGSLRERAVAALDPAPGDLVVDMGCGTGANFPSLRERVGPEGTVVGVDFTPGMVARARHRIEREGWENVHVVRGDATRPPIAAADSLFSSFVSGMLADPAAVVDGWCDLVGSGGRVGVLDLGRSTRPVGRPANALFHGLVFAASPSKRGAVTGAASALDARIAAAQRRLRERCSDATYSTHALGFARLGVGTVD
ncbi:class I SAM-dependent methyltransferase [Halobium salinum]|uniref:Class I SAM-dependent methyltransferase n=1 Tax=Halobium salinum TaxID=1364940 RepID=A0ABD5PCV8_9EURY|nr:methyltransferase domain-containing protein [Halobium salinum]